MIAISYRREDSLPVAGRLYDRLQAEFGKGNVFMDFDSIPYGVDFREHIKKVIERSKLVVALIGPDWMGKGRRRTRRIDDPADFVRLEITYALERALPVIPVLLNDTPMPRVGDLPVGIEALAFRNGLVLDAGLDFHHHADRLIVGINWLLKGATTSVSTASKEGPPEVSRQIETSPATIERKPEPVETAVVSATATVLPPAPPPKPPPVEPSRPPAETTPAEISTSSAERLESAVKVPKESAPPITPRKLPVIEPPKPAKSKPPSESRMVIKTPVSIFGADKAGWLARVKKSVTKLQDKVMADYVRPSRLGREQKPVRSAPSHKRSALVGAITLFAIVAGAGWYWGAHGLGRGSSDKTEPAIAQASPASPFENKEEPAAAVNRPLTQAQETAAPAPAGSVSVPEESPPAIAAVSPTQITAPAATSPAPSLPPADYAELRPTAPNWQARMNEFVQQFIESDSSADVERELSFYAASAEILNEGEKNHDRIRHDIQSDHDRWPIRRNNIRGEVRLAEMVPNQEYTAAFEQDYHDENPARGKSVNGGVAVDVTIKMIDGSPKISSIKHKPLPKGNGSTPMPAPRTPVQESPTSASPLASTAFEQGPQHLVRIVNKAYGFSTLVPADVFPDAARPSDVDRTSFSSASGRTTLNLLVRENSGGETFKKLYQEWIAEHTAERPNKKVHYKVFRDTWFVASGIDGQRGERGFYVKAVNKGNNIVMMSLEYDENASPLTNQTLLKMVQAFNGN